MVSLDLGVPRWRWTALPADDSGCGSEGPEHRGRRQRPRCGRSASTMMHIDSVLLNLAEWSCHRFQRLTGRTNVWLAVQLTNLSIVVYFAWAGLYTWGGSTLARVLIALFCVGLAFGLARTILAVPIEAAEAAAYERAAKGLRNPRRIRDALLRISFLTLSLLLWYPVVLVYVHLRMKVVLLSYSLVLLTTVVLYLLACDPLPPCTGKLRQWIWGSAPSRPDLAPAGTKARVPGR
jgi:hypothetical protein